MSVPNYRPQMGMLSEWSFWVIPTVFIRVKSDQIEIGWPRLCLCGYVWVY